MNTTEHLLTCLAEEGAEITQDCAKALRFGLDDTNVLHPEGPNNRERIIAELNDVLGVADLMVEQNILPADWQDKAAQKRKKEKVVKFMDYAAKQGALSF